ncbi:MAG TPA: hypothetical protein VGL76_03415 [Gaiellaceae bacterium]|jgi:hypothetical protein
MTRALAAVVALSLVAAGTAAAAIYPGSAQKLAPPPSEIAFTTLVKFAKTTTPKGALAKGYKQGVAAFYEKGTAKKPVEAVATIYVYSSAAATKAAWTSSCAKCKVEKAPAGLRLKAEAGTNSGLPALHEITTCSNVYLDVLEISSEKAAAIDNDVVKITNAVLVRALHSGLSSCTAK